MSRIWNDIGGWFCDMSDRLHDFGWHRAGYWSYKVYDKMDDVWYNMIRR